MAKRSGQWFGDTRAQTIENIPAVADVISLLPVANALESIRDLVLERVVLQFSISRLTNNSLTDLMWMVYKGRVQTGSTIPLEALNPRSASSPVMAHANILQVGILPVPAVMQTFDSAGAQVAVNTNREVMTKEYDFHVKRKIQRDSEAIMLTMAASADEVVSMMVRWRIYYTYA